MQQSKKQLAFDLDTKALKRYYPTDSWNGAYDVIRRHMEKNGFRWMQGSVYVSNDTMSSYRVTKVLKDLLKTNPWLNLCMRDCRETNIGREHSKNHLFDKNADIKPHNIEPSNKMFSFLEDVVHAHDLQENADVIEEDLER